MDEGCARIKALQASADAMLTLLKDEAQLVFLAQANKVQLEHVAECPECQAAGMGGDE